MSTIEDERTLKVKNEIIAKLKRTHFKYHNYINLTEYVLAWPDLEHNNNGVAKDVAKKLQESGEFTYKEEGTFPEFWVEKTVKKPLSETRPVASQIRTGFITLVFSLIGSIIIYKMQSREKTQVDTQQNTHLNNLSDSASRFAKSIEALEDSIKTRH
ncbi:hypothetical protein BH10BAC2_BH10BAC2_07190 [soil metagenome]